MNIFSKLCHTIPSSTPPTPSPPSIKKDIILKSKYIFVFFIRQFLLQKMPQLLRWYLVKDIKTYMKISHYIKGVKHCICEWGIIVDDGNGHIKGYNLMVNIPAFLMLLTNLNIQVPFTYLNKRTFFKQRSYSIIPNFILSIFLKNDFNITSLKTQSLGFLICFEIIIDFPENCMFFCIIDEVKYFVCVLFM